MPTVAELLVKIGANNNELKGKLGEAKQEVGKFTQSIKSAAGAIGIAFGVREIINFTKQAVLLAGQMEGVEAAFNRLNKPGLLSELQKATQNTVSDLELMKSAVQASNFQIPVEQLGKLFEFATKRAAATGESVDYLVNSIVTGIGRKSPLILDNLGISAVRLRDALGEAGTEAASVGDIARVVGKIADEELTKMGKVTKTTAQEAQTLSAEFTNLQITIGEKLAPVMKVFLTGTAQGLSGLNTLLSTEVLTGWQKFKAVLLAGAGASNYFGSISNSVAKNITTDQEKYKKLREELNGLFSDINKGGQDVAKSGIVKTFNQESLDALKEFAKNLEVIDSIQQRNKSTVQELTGIYEILFGTFQQVDDQLEENTNNFIDRIDKQIAAIAKQSEIEKTKLEQTKKANEIQKELNLQVIAGFAEATAAAIQNAKSFADASRIIIGALIKEVVALAVRNALADSAALGPIAVPLALAAGAAAQGIFNRLVAGAVPQLETGTNFVPNDGLYYLHQGEAVVPKQYNPATGGSGGPMEIYIYGMSGDVLKAIERKEARTRNLIS